MPPLVSVLGASWSGPVGGHATIRWGKKGTAESRAERNLTWTLSRSRRSRCSLRRHRFVLELRPIVENRAGLRPCPGEITSIAIDVRDGWLGRIGCRRRAYLPGAARLDCGPTGNGELGRLACRCGVCFRGIPGTLGVGGQALYITRCGCRPSGESSDITVVASL